MGTMFYKDEPYGGGSESAYIVRQVTASAGTQIYVPASGTDSRIKTTGCEIKVVSQKKSDGTPYKFKSVQIYDGYAIITLGEALSGVYMGIKVTKNGYNVNDLIPMEYEEGGTLAKTYTISGYTSQAYVYRLGQLRIIFGYVDNPAAGIMFNLDAEDRPSEAIRFPLSGGLNHVGGNGNLYTDGRLAIADTLSGMMYFNFAFIKH